MAYQLIPLARRAFYSWGKAVHYKDTDVEVDFDGNGDEAARQVLALSCNRKYGDSEKGIDYNVTKWSDFSTLRVSGRMTEGYDYLWYSPDPNVKIDYTAKCCNTRGLNYLVIANDNSDNDWGFDIEKESEVDAQGRCPFLSRSCITGFGDIDTTGGIQAEYGKSYNHNPGAFQNSDIKYVYVPRTYDTKNYIKKFEIDTIGDYAFYNSVYFNGIRMADLNDTELNEDNAYGVNNIIDEYGIIITINNLGYKAFCNTQFWPKGKLRLKNIGTQAFAYEQNDEPRKSEIDLSQYKKMWSRADIEFIEGGVYGEGIFANTDIEDPAKFINAVVKSEPQKHKLPAYTFMNTRVFSEKDQEIDLSGVTVIGKYCFANCWRIKKITIPASVTEIEEGAFQNCANLAEVTFADRTSNLKLGPDIFSGTKITSITINSGNHDLTINSTFNQCSQLNTIELKCGGKLEIIGKAFATISNGHLEITNSLISSELTIAIDTAFMATSIKTIQLITQGKLTITNGSNASSSFGTTNLDTWKLGTKGSGSDLLSFSKNEGNIKLFRNMISKVKGKLYLNNEIFQFITEGYNYEEETIKNENLTKLGIFGINETNDLSTQFCKIFPKLQYVGLLTQNKYKIKENAFSYLDIVSPQLLGVLENIPEVGETTKFQICDLVSEIEAKSFTYALSNRNSITEIILPFVSNNTITEIFEIIPSSLTTIKCTQELEIPEKAFYGINTLTSVYLNENVTTIGDEAFRRNNTKFIDLYIYGKSTNTPHPLSKLKLLGKDVFTYGENNAGVYPNDNDNIIFLYGSGPNKVTIPTNTRLIARCAIKDSVTTLETPLLNHRKEIKNEDEDEKFTPGTTTQISYICEDVSKLQNLCFTQDITIYRDETYKPFQGISSLNTLEFQGNIEDSGSFGHWLSFQDKISITNLKFNKNVPYQFLSKEGNYIYNITNLTLNSGVDIIEENAFTGLSSALKTIKITGANNTSIKFGANAFDISNCVLDEVEYGLTLKQWLTQNEFKSLTSNPIRLTYNFKTSNCSNVYKIDNTTMNISNPTTETEIVVIKPYALAGNKFLNEVDVTFLDVNYTVGEETYNPAQSMPLQGYALIDVYSDESLKPGGAERANKLIGNAQLRKNYKEEYSSFIIEDTGGEE